MHEEKFINRGSHPTQYAWVAKLPAVPTVVLSEAQMPKGEKDSNTPPDGYVPPTVMKKNGKEDHSALGVGHGVLSVGVGSAILYIGLASQYNVLVSGVSAYLARGFALMHLLNGINPDAKDKNAFTNALALGPSYHSALRVSSFTSIIAAILATNQLESLGLPILAGFLLVGTTYGLIGQSSISRRPSTKV